MEILRMTKAHLEDFLCFHQSVDLTHAPHWKGCYCQYYYMTENDGDFLNLPSAVRRNLAIARIQEQAMNGYLAFEQGEVIGWMSVDHLKRYRRLDGMQSLRFEEKTALIACMLLKKEYRGKGLSTAMITFAREDLKVQGFYRLIALPFESDTAEQNYHGSVKLFERLGFVLTGGDDQHPVYQSIL